MVFLFQKFELYERYVVGLIIKVKVKRAK